MLNEKQLVLCRDGNQESVCKELKAAGCVGFECASIRGVPEGWVLFVNVCPTAAVDHEESAGIFNVLRPIQDADIYFEGGVRLTHKKWLHGHPPRIRIRGIGNQAKEVSIDDQAANLEEDGCYKTLTAFDLGRHVVFCGGATAQFEIVDGQESWERFIAYAYSIDPDSQTELSVCGPIVMGHGEQSLVPTTNRCLIGAQPGQISICQSPYGQAADNNLAITDFPVAWALPDNPYQCNKSRVFAKSLSAIEVVPVIKSYERQKALRLRRWCDAILNASRKGLRTDPASATVEQRWVEYIKVARQIRRSLE